MMTGIWVRLAALGIAAVLAGSCGGGVGDRPDALSTDAEPSENATLAALTTSAGMLVPPFEPDVTEYLLDLPSLQPNVAFTPTAAAANGATIAVDGSEVRSGEASLPLTLTPGGRDVEVVVVAPGGTALTYRVHVRCGAPTIQLSVEGEVLDRLTPAFDVDTMTYSVDVGIGISSMRVMVVPIEAGSTITVNGEVAVAGIPTLPLPLNLGLTTVLIRITTPGGVQRTYSLTVSRAGAVLQQAYAKASNPEFSDFFGTSVALWGDTLAVGADYEASAATGIDGNQLDNNAPRSGAVYVFTRAGETWSQQAYLKASNTGMYDSFGSSIALWGDTLVVGAINEASAATGVDGNQLDNNVPQAGAAYVFTRTGGTWTQQAYLKASNTGVGDRFGGSLAISHDTLAIGAFTESSAATGVDGDQDNNSASDSGAVYVFTRTDGAWSQQAYLKASNTGAGDQFGRSLALWGDTLAVGAFVEASGAIGVDGNQSDNSALASGAAYVFVRSGSTWSQEAYLKASNANGGDRFGWSTALWGDTLAVGAFGEASAATGVDGAQADNSAADSGAVYVFGRVGATWSQQAYLKASNTEASDGFSRSIALWGDTLVVSAYYEDSAATGVNGNQADNAATFSGAVYVFTRGGASWSQQSYIKASNTEASDYLNATALWGDTLAIGAIGEDSGATGVGGNQADNSVSVSGAVYIFQ